MSFKDYMNKSMRLTILRVLLDTPGFQANSSVLFEMLNQLGAPVTRGDVIAQLRWLAGESLITVEDIGSVVLATLLERGQDVADGLEFVDGVARKSK